MTMYSFVVLDIVTDTGYVKAVLLRLCDANRQRIVQVVDKVRLMHVAS